MWSVGFGLSVFGVLGFGGRVVLLKSQLLVRTGGEEGPAGFFLKSMVFGYVLI